jgi:exodeoxyribonuclease VII small subunit
MRTCNAAMSQMRDSRFRGCESGKVFAVIDYFHPRMVAVLPSGDPLKRRPLANQTAKEPTVPRDILSLSFEDALKELEGIVQQLERGQVKLDEAITAYERGALLKRHCEQKLAEAKMKVEKIVFASDGTVSAQPADLG